MNTYPTLSCGISLPFKPQVDSGLEVARATNGDTKVYSYYSQDHSTVDLLHKLASATDKTALDAFYAANKLLKFILVVGGATYTAQFAKAPQPELIKGGRWNFIVPLLLF